MKKIKTVFMIDRNAHRATDVVVVDWVLAGEGTATIKFDGTSCMISGGKLFRRFDRKHGKAVPEGWTPCEVEPDANTGHWPGWLPVHDAPENRHHLEAFTSDLDDGTYELVGPKVERNPYGLSRHELWKHGSVVVEVERTREAIVRWLTDTNHEGIVFHHPDGRMAKVRRKDFGIKWK